MTITKDLKKLLFDCFGLDAVGATAEAIFERMEEPTEEELFQAIDDQIIYYVDQWEIMQFYQTPQEANFNEAIELFTNDLLDILYKVNA